VASNPEPGLWYVLSPDTFAKGTCTIISRNYDFPLAWDREAIIERASVPDDVKETFEALAAQWKRETLYISSFTKIVMNASYQKIIGMGPAVVPLLLQDLERAPKHWFWALASITRENPVKDEDAGNLEKMTKAWLDWGRLRGYV
jgi:hypothetical protein